MSEPEGKDRRATARFTSANLINYRPDPPEEEITAEQFEEQVSGAETLDLSAGGCKILTRDKLPLKTELTFDLKLDDHVLSVRGRTVRARRQEDGRYAIGIEFIDLDDFARDQLELYIVETGAEEAK